MNILLLISVAYSIVITVLLRRFYLIFFTECRVSTRTEWLLYSLYCALSLAVFLLFHRIYLLYIGLNILFKYLLALIYIGSQKRRIILALLFSVVTAVVEGVLVLLMLPVTVNPNYYEGYSAFHFVGPLFVAIFMYVFVFIVEGVKSRKTWIRFPLKYLLSVIATPLLTFFLMESFLLLPVVPIGTLGFCSFVMLLINFCSFYFYEIVVSYITHKMERDIAEEKNLYYAKQLDAQTSMLDSLRSYQHDLKNYAIVADAYFDNDEYEKVREYYYEVMRRPLLGNKEFYSGNTVVDSLLNYKNFEAKKKGVTLNVSMTIPPTLRISSSTLAIVFGNLLDNAIEAAEQTEEKNVDVKLTYAHHCLMMKMKNPYIGKVVKTADRFLSTKEKAILHGYGLRNVKRIVDANGGTLKFNSNHNIFTVTLLLRDETQEMSQE